MAKSAEYLAYHAKVVDACVALMGEQCREFFDKECDYLEEFEAGADPSDVAIAQEESL